MSINFDKMNTIISLIERIPLIWSDSWLDYWIDQKSKFEWIGGPCLEMDKVSGLFWAMSDGTEPITNDIVGGAMV